jgi:hypothetical protein
MRHWIPSLIIPLFSLLLTLNAARGSDKVESSEANKNNAEAIKAVAEASEISIGAVAKKQKLEAEAVKLLAEARTLASEHDLNLAKRDMIYAEIARLEQKMRISAYEFQRIVRADYQMHYDIERIESHVTLIRPLFLGRANWKTWVGLEYLLQQTGDADLILAVMFETKVPPLKEEDFERNDGFPQTKTFTGTNLGQLYSFARAHDFSFRQYGDAHKMIMKVLAFITKAAQLRIEQYRQINQSVRLTIAEIP